MSSKKAKTLSHSAKKSRNSSSPAPVKSSCSRHKRSSSKAEPSLKTSARENFDWLAALKQPIPSAVKTYKVLSQPIRHELNKYFYDVSDTPSRAERQLLLQDLWQIDYTVTMKKLVKYFQNKRHYVKNHVPQRHPLPTNTCTFSDVDSDPDLESDSE